MLEALKKIVSRQVSVCTDVDLLDLICKLLAHEAGEVAA